MSVYHEKYPVGTTVRIAPLDHLEEFKRTWRYHHPLASEQLAMAGLLATVKEIGFYHGGDVLYELDGAPGIWHESCLSGAEGGGAA